MATYTRRGLFGLGFAASSVALAGCAGMGGGSQQSGDANNLQFWSNHPGSSKSVEQELIKGFEQASQGVKITLVDGGKDYEEVAQKFNAALSGGDLPDIVVVSDVTWFNFALNKQLAPIDDLAQKAGLDLSDYVKPLYADYQLEGKHYALPYSRSTPLFYYNKTMWKAAGLPDKGPESWDQLREWSDALRSKAGAKLACAMANGANYLDWTFQGLAWSMDGAYSKDFTATFTDPNTVKAATFVQEFKKSGLFDVSPDPAPVFSSGQAACIVESTGSLQAILKGSAGKFEVGTAFLPGPKGRSCPTGGAGLAIPAGISEERKINALKAIGFLTNTDSTATFAEATGYMPVRTSALQTQKIKDYLAKVPQAKTALDQLEYTKPQDAARVFVAGGGKQIGGALDKIVQGQSVPTVLGDLQAWMKPKLDDLAKKVK
ncbi:ABC transporter substrate-binding protein [Devriesea agamarum]|uniref:ABC transporter substrate-binding protein n=1 Tax=Devriesea agamarum TaxID=472569 RepID=UPI00071C3508|nr:ABC transporter substrate-binding protein [Devriesea agamarum]